MIELIMDHVSEFGDHRVREDDRWDGQFKQHLEKYGIKPILARVMHPQTNGKLEKWFDAYRRFRSEFSSFGEFIEGYNDKGLDFDKLETPKTGFHEENAS